MIVQQGLEAPDLDTTFRLYYRYLAKMDETLGRQAFLAGDSFSLADAAVLPYVNRLDMMQMSELWTNTMPHLTRWFAEMKSRPSFKPALLDWCPPDLTEDLRRNGPQSWPGVKRLLQLG